MPNQNNERTRAEELYDMLGQVKERRDGLKAELKIVESAWQNLRAAASLYMEEQGGSSHTDSASGVNTRFSYTDKWVITDMDALLEAIKASDYLTNELMKLVVDEARAIELAAEGLEVPGVEFITTRTLYVNGPKKK